MKKQTLFKNSIFLTIFLGLLLSFNNPAFAIVTEAQVVPDDSIANENPKADQYAPGGFLVKFKQGARIGMV